MAYLAYEEPGITIILSLASFLLLLNASRYMLDRLLYCGIIVEILIGIIWGEPVGGISWLSLGTQETIQSLGYLGLIGLVFEGGLGTNLELLRKNAGMSVAVATVGLLMPIALSFLLLVFPFPSSSGTLYPTPLAAFSAGASLCSTSLGTTFAILSSAGMKKTKIGTVLVGAAMMDDVVGLVMVNIVTTLGSAGTGGWPIARPIAASFGLLLLTLAIAPYMLKPCWLFIAKHYRQAQDQEQCSSSRLQRIAAKLLTGIPHASFLISTSVLIIYVTIAAFIDASVFFAAFIAGGMVSYLWKSQPSPDNEEKDGPTLMYDEYYKSPMDYILVPFFFASIGFSIPIEDMFSGSIVWKGIVYSILMIIAKGLVSLVIYAGYFIKLFRHRPSKARQTSRTTAIRDASASLQKSPPHADELLVGFAMIARGEIGFLIASLSQSSGTLELKQKSGGPAVSGESIFLVIVWAVVLCTIIGPVAVGIIVRRQNQRAIHE